MGEPSLTDYRHQMRMHADPEAIFAFVADATNLPKYLDFVRQARPLDEGRVALEVRAGDRTLALDGFLRRDPRSLRLDWGLDGDLVSGSLRINRLDGVCEVVVELSIDGVPSELRRPPSDGAVADALVAALHSVHNHVEGRLHKEAGRQPS